MDIRERFEAVIDSDSNEYLEFDKVENKRSSRCDIHAFILLNELFPGTFKILGAAEHDEVWLDVSLNQAETLTDEQILELVRCGISCDDDGLRMGV